MRPRDLLNFLRRATEVAINRGHDRVTEDDVLAAEKAYSEDMLSDMTFELRDSYPDIEKLPFLFIDEAAVLSPDRVNQLIGAAKLTNADADRVVEVLVWFGFLGVQIDGHDEPEYSYQVRYNVDKLLAPIRSGRARFTVHPAFHQALSTESRYE